jgi:prepilin-type N-terminal cleavage/methylation domain-containing protein
MIKAIISDGKSQRGFTLIEVLIAMAVIAVGLISLVTLFPIGLRSSRLAGDFTTASFVVRQALDDTRARARVNDPADTSFDDTNGNGLGYYELPISAVKGHLTDILFPNQPQRSHSWTITMIDATNYSVQSSLDGAQGTGRLGFSFKADNEGIQLTLSDNDDGGYYESFVADDKIVIHVEMHGGNPYYWFAMRAPVTEDVDLDGILDGPAQAFPDNQTDEDTGLDLTPDYWDKNDSRSYERGVDEIGEAGFSGVNDPHGDNMYEHLVATTAKWDTGQEINPDGLEGNGVIDEFAEYDMQKVVVVVGWREGGQDRISTFSTVIANQFR